MSEALLALLGAIFGGAGLKLIEALLSRNRAKIDAATEFRKELREEVTLLREELSKARKEIDEWRERYYSIMEKYHLLQIGRHGEIKEE
jgi:peptidoglycan hydrolase CwlO-like protein